jgi:hypothetical protein
LCVVTLIVIYVVSTFRRALYRAVGVVLSSVHAAPGTVQSADHDDVAVAVVPLGADV